jgi:NAD(P)-dependent dehydrogenase (short-subunit alcohol dehydrogenase family)
MPETILDGRVAIVTGAGRGLGREHAIELARQGASVVVNDYGVTLSGENTKDDPAHEVAATIREFGGTAVVNNADVADFGASGAMIQQAIDTFGGLDIVVNNAGFVRDRMLVNATEDEWDAVIRVHLKGHFCSTRHAAAYWRAESKAGRPRQARIINTSSGAGLQGSVGQASYSAAKAGIAALTLVAAQELAPYGITVNAIAPSARTRMTEGPFAEAMTPPADGFDAMAPANVAPIVAWLASAGSESVTGRVIEVEGGRVCVEEGWVHGPSLDLGRRWSAPDVGDNLLRLLADARTPEPVYGSR